MKALNLALFVSLLPLPALSQDLMRSFELPSHRALVDQSLSAELTAFETDGCSGGLSASWRWVAEQFPQVGELYEEHPPWEYCCVTHDQAYHNAGGAVTAEESYDARLAADDALHACVVEHGNRYAEHYGERYEMTPKQIRDVHAITADAMYGAVRFGGGPCSGLPWRWGFGYPGCSILR
ncbi:MULTISPECIES: hypothetical protein [unclassified Ruegeria]|uniref:hypothetical protein n=1 Tax=unclassified Ruegeria TaxID=2625375 RepID=UPI001492585B|nr:MULTISPECIES: hypothetical protein [unclassified Ruegeria]NOD34919.1 hypothetical protein [Ruegeria sp. HKCCD7296]NOE42104.1 hypothetical protein [Ruegeria sp. HKCCD7319]